MSTIPTTAYPSAPVPAQRPGWFARNWKWFVPCGCATILVAFVVIICAIVGIVMYSTKQSDVYAMSLAKVQSSQEVTGRLGTPVKPGWWMSGNINVSGPSGNADISFPISGPKGKATVYATGTKSTGRWRLDLLQVAYDGSEERTNLLPDRSPDNTMPREQSPDKEPSHESDI